MNALRAGRLGTGRGKAEKQGKKFRKICNKMPDAAYVLIEAIPDGQRPGTDREQNIPTLFK